MSAVHLLVFLLNPLLKPPRSGEGSLRDESLRRGLGIGITRPLCGIQRDGNRKSQGALARSRSGRVCRRQRTAPLCEFPGSAVLTFSLVRSTLKGNQGAKRYLIPPNPVLTAAKRRWESEGRIPSGRFGRQPKVTPVTPKSRSDLKEG